MPKSNGRKRIRNKNKTPSRKKSGKVFANVVFLMILVYLMGSIMNFASKSSVDIQSVQYGAIDSADEIKGVIIRSEKVAVAPRDGTVAYNYNDGDKVGKGSVVCSVRNGAVADEIERQIQLIDKDILNVQKSREDVSVYRDEIKNVQKSISETVASYYGSFSEGDLSRLYSFKSDIENDLNFRNDIWLSEDAQSLQKLSGEKRQYAAKLGENMTDIKAEEGGVISLRYDGMEGSLTFDNINAVTKETIDSAKKPAVITGTSGVKTNEPVFKIITSNDWYIVAYIPASLTQNWEIGMQKQAYISDYGDGRSFSAAINELTPAENGANRVVFKCTDGLLDFLNYRAISFKVYDGVYKGLKVPNSAIMEKSLLKIPSQCVIEQNGESGVIKVSEQEREFVPINILKHIEDETGEYDCVDQLANGVSIGDAVLNGEEKVKLSEVATFNGVYVVNSSVANFKIVDILTKNNDYAIARPNATNGLKVYDNIAVDAKSIKEADSIN